MVDAYLDNYFNLLIYIYKIRAHVVITDLAEFLPLMELNIDKNKSSIHSGNIIASTLSWLDTRYKQNPKLH